MSINSSAKKQVPASHLTAESEMVSSEDRLRTEALQVFTFWGQVVQVFDPKATDGRSQRNVSVTGGVAFGERNTSNNSEILQMATPTLPMVFMVPTKCMNPTTMEK